MLNITEFTDKKNIIALVGASNNPEKYGNKVFLDLKNAGYQVHPVNISEDLIAGEKCYKSITDLSKEKKIDLVITVVPPKITETIITECIRLRIKKVWMQPGSESETAVKMCEDNSISQIHDMCIMIEKRRK